MGKIHRVHGIPSGGDPAKQAYIKERYASRNPGKAFRFWLDPVDVVAELLGIREPPPKTTATYALYGHGHDNKPRSKSANRDGFSFGRKATTDKALTHSQSASVLIPSRPRSAPPCATATMTTMTTTTVTSLAPTPGPTVPTLSRPASTPTFLAVGQAIRTSRSPVKPQAASDKSRCELMGLVAPTHTPALAPSIRVVSPSGYEVPNTL